MKIRRIGWIIQAFCIMMLLSACRVGPERYELTNFVGKSISSFEKGSGTELVEQSNGIYIMKDVVQVMVPDKEVTSVTLLWNAGEYMVFGIKIGMTKAEADPLLNEVFGKEIAKTINSTNNAVTYTYLKKDKELYISYDVDKETVTELSYYKVKAEDKKAQDQEPVNAGELIAMIGGSKVYYNEAMVYLKSAQEKYENDYGKGIWDVDILGNGETFGEMIKNEVINQITELKIIRAEAEKQEITLSEEELSEANTYAREHYEGLTKEDIDRYLVTEELLQKVYADNLLANKLFESMTINVDNNVSELEANQITVWHILIYGVDYDEAGNKIALTTEERSEAYEKVRALLEQAKTTEDFYALAEANSEADTIEYTFGRNKGPDVYSSAFEQAAFTLKTGQVSDIITTEYGWHIIYSVTDFNEDATIQAKEAIIEERRNNLFAQSYSEWTKEYDIVINDEAWNAITFED